jgi:acetate kinase
LRIITLQLGAGASAAAIQGGRPLDVSMGYSTLEGLVMATRCGDVDPGLVLSLLARGDHDVASLAELLSRRSGLLGLSGYSSRIGELLARADDARCQLAVDVYVHRIRHYVGAYLALLGGADAIVFGGGAGENEPELRRRVIEGFDWAGFALDVARNAASGAHGALGDARTGDARRVLVARVDEAFELACAAIGLLRQGAGGPH